MKIAIVHDQLQEFGGAERVLVSLMKIFPQADIITSFYNPKTLGIHAEQFKDKKIITSWANKVPLLKKLYSPLRFITPWIWESLNLFDYDLVISSSGSYMSKGVITRPETPHICYLHHQPRYLYYYETAIEWQKYLLIKIYGNLINHNLRLWDYLSSKRVDYFLANSEETKRRIKKFYRQDAKVIYPPVNLSDKNISSTSFDNKKYFLTVSRLARAKHIDTLIEAANEKGFNLKIVGSGRDEKYLKSISGKTVEFLGPVKDQDLPQIYNNAQAFLFASVDEEFGIAPVEAMGYGLPVITYRSGGLPEIVENNTNGYLFDKLNPKSLNEKITQILNLKQNQYLNMRLAARKTAEKFSEEKFKKEILEFVNSKLNARTT